MPSTSTPRAVVDQDHRFMARALDLASSAKGRTSPNPLVGCVIVNDDRIVGEGFHARAGTAHAEVVALQQAGAQARGATVYVTLEPCNHHGRTPPCTDALIAAGVARVVIASPDPNPKAGGGTARLADAGIAVSTGVLQDEAEAQNEPFRKVQSVGRPFVLYKTAMTLDGKIATRSGQSRWITGEPARQRVQQWRNELDAIAVGVNTVLLDDPQLTTRLDGGRTPVKVVFDSMARMSPSARLFEPDTAGVPARVIVFVTAGANTTRTRALAGSGAEVITLPEVNGRPDISAALRGLAQRGLNSLLLEGGGTLAWSFLQAQAIDRIAWFIAPLLVGGPGRSPLGGLGVERMSDAFRLKDTQNEWINGDLLITGSVDYGKAL